MSIKLVDILAISSPQTYKLHLACRNPDYVEPLDVFVTNRQDWVKWNEWRGSRNDWTRKRILSFIEFYPEPGTWLFGGAFEVMERRIDGYSVAEITDFEKYTGRLIARFHRYQGLRGRAFKLESLIDDFTVHKVLPRSYSGEGFPGFENINHSFNDLKAVFKNQKTDWRAALASVKGIYLITDRATGKMYIGSAYGETGIWSRWSCYIGTGHGWNDELVILVREKGVRYASENLWFSVLEVMARSTPDDFVIARESHWKRVLMTRKFGYNLN